MGHIRRGARALVQVCNRDPVVPSDQEYDYAARDPRVSAMTFQSVHIYTPPTSRPRQVSDAVGFLGR